MGWDGTKHLLGYKVGFAMGNVSFAAGYSAAWYKRVNKTPIFIGSMS